MLTRFIENYDQEAYKFYLFALLFSPSGDSFRSSFCLYQVSCKNHLVELRINHLQRINSGEIGVEIGAKQSLYSAVLYKSFIW